LVSRSVAVPVDDDEAAPLKPLALVAEAARDNDCLLAPLVVGVVEVVASASAATVVDGLASVSGSANASNEGRASGTAFLRSRAIWGGGRGVVEGTRGGGGATGRWGTLDGWSQPPRACSRQIRNAYVGHVAALGCDPSERDNGSWASHGERGSAMSSAKGAADGEGRWSQRPSRNSHHCVRPAM